MDENEKLIEVINKGREITVAMMVEVVATWSGFIWLIFFTQLAE